MVKPKKKPPKLTLDEAIARVHAHAWRTDVEAIEWHVAEMRAEIERLRDAVDDLALEAREQVGVAFALRVAADALVGALRRAANEYESAIEVLEGLGDEYAEPCPVRRLYPTDCKRARRSRRIG